VFLSRFRPIIETTRRIADGDLGARVGAARGTAEVRSLGADIDRMAASLEQRTRALQASERRYRTLIDEFPGGAVLYFDRDLVFRFAGGASLETVGYQQAEVEGHTVQEVQQHDGSVVEHRYRAVLNGEVHTAESVKNGHVFESLPVPVRDEHGQVIAGMSILRDVTDQRRAAAAVRESQERLRLIIETMADGLMVRDRDGRYIEATGEIAGVVSTLTDVTARVEAERALRVSLERLARIIEMIA
jgi:PAS domain S-box-containing protein